MTERLEEEEASNEKLTTLKKKLEKQNEELSQDVESAEGNIKRLEKEKGVSFQRQFLQFNKKIIKLKMKLLTNTFSLTDYIAEIKVKSCCQSKS